MNGVRLNSGFQPSCVNSHRDLGQIDALQGRTPTLGFLGYRYKVHDCYHCHPRSRLHTGLPFASNHPSFAGSRRRARRAYPAVQPPSSIRALPVMSVDASEARNTAAPDTSSTLPRRPSLIFERTSWRNSLSSKNGLVKGVSMNVGQIGTVR